MKAFTTFLAAATLVAAQDISKYMPSCALKCLQDAVASATKCQPLDGKCICDRPNFEATYNSGTACVLQACGSDTALTQVLPGTYKYCEDVLAGAGGSSSSLAPPTGTPSPRPTSAPTASDVSILPVTSSGSSVTNATAATTTPAQTTSPGAATTPAPAGGAAAAGATAGAGLVAALGAGLLALL